MLALPRSHADGEHTLKTSGLPPKGVKRLLVRRRPCKLIENVLRRFPALGQGSLEAPQRRRRQTSRPLAQRRRAVARFGGPGDMRGVCERRL